MSWKWNEQGGGLVWNDKEGYAFIAWNKAVWSSEGGWQWSREAGYVYEGDSSALKEMMESLEQATYGAGREGPGQKQKHGASAAEAPQVSGSHADESSSGILRTKEGQPPRKRRQHSPTPLARAMARLTLEGER